MCKTFPAKIFVRVVYCKCTKQETEMEHKNYDKLFLQSFRAHKYATLVSGLHNDVIAPNIKQKNKSLNCFVRMIK